MNHRHLSHYAAPVLAVSLLCSQVAHAEIYRWVDDNGKVQYGDAPPSLDPSVTELNRKGLKNESRSNQRSPSTSAAYVDPRVKALNAAKRAGEVSEADSALLSSFGSEQDIVLARDQRLSTLDQSIRFNQHSIKQWESMQSVLNNGGGQGSSREIDQKKQQLAQWITEAKRNITLINDEKQKTEQTFSQHLSRFRDLHKP